MTDTYFESLSLENWRQFSKVEIKFHRRMTIITGGNGSGKSTILRILAQHFGWSASMLATPRTNRSGLTRYFAGIVRWNVPSQSQNIGSLEYSTGQRSVLRVPSETAVQYNVEFESMAGVSGINVSSHRVMPVYQAVGSIPTNPMRPEAAYSNYFNEMVQRSHGSHTGFSPIFRMKEAIISMATFGPGNENVTANNELRDAFNGFVSVLKRVLPPSIGFKGITIRLPDVMLVTTTGEFVIDASSGGMMSIIDLAWQIYLFSLNNDKFVVILDEPENHLHPAMQREILGSLLTAFPTAQFIVATHSPFIVSAVRESAVYVLRHIDDEEMNQVASTRLDQVEKAGTANEILRDVLGVPVTLPLWAEDDLSRITNEFVGQEISKEVLKTLRARLSEAGLSEYYSEALTNIANSQ